MTTLTRERPASHSPTVRTQIQFRPSNPFHQGWNRLPGLTVTDDLVIIDPHAYFERLEDPTWRYVPWEVVQAHWNDLSETGEVALEQACLSFIREHVQTTDDPAVILTNADAVYSYLFDEARLSQYEELPVEGGDLRVLRESSILCALNKVSVSGRIANIGPAWYFAQCARVVYDLSAKDEARVDELFHGGFFNGPRLRDQVRAHVSLAGKLVHGCQGSGHGSGGCVVAYGTNVDAMQEELMRLKPRFLAIFENLKVKGA